MSGVPTVFAVVPGCWTAEAAAWGVDRQAEVARHLPSRHVRRLVRQHRLLTQPAARHRRPHRNGTGLAAGGIALRGAHARPLWRAFLSHTGDLRHHPADRSFVAAAEAAVIRSGHAVIDMAYFGPHDALPAATCARMMADATIYVGVVGRRYGSTVPALPDVSYTELEYEVATRLGLTRLIFLIREDSPALPPVDQTPEAEARQAAFRKRLRHGAGLTVAMVASPAELELELLHALAALEASANGA